MGVAFLHTEYFCNIFLFVCRLTSGRDILLCLQARMQQWGTKLWQNGSHLCQTGASEELPADVKHSQASTGSLSRKVGCFARDRLWDLFRERLCPVAPLGSREMAAVPHLEQSLSLTGVRLEGTKHSPGGLDKTTSRGPFPPQPFCEPAIPPSSYSLPKFPPAGLVSFMYVLQSPQQLLQEGRVLSKRIAEVVTDLCSADFTRWRSVSCKPVSIIHSGGIMLRAGRLWLYYVENPTAIRVNFASD